MLITVLVPGSCGEIAQGWQNGQPFMITCPIELYSRALVTDRTSVKSGFGPKARAAMEATIRYMGFKKFPLGLSLESQLPSGKGMAGSTADVVAVIQAVATAVDDELEPDEIAELATGIEPTDGIFYPGVVKMNYMTGELLKSYGDAPKMTIAIFDTGGTINTVDFHAEHSIHEDSPAELLAAIDELEKDFTPERIANVATMSALCNQKLVHKKQLEEIIEYATGLGALGVNVAHSGTVIGIMFAPNESMKKVMALVKLIKMKFPHLEYFSTERMTSGGCKVAQR